MRTKHLCEEHFFRIFCRISGHFGASTKQGLGPWHKRKDPRAFAWQLAGGRLQQAAGTGILAICSLILKRKGERSLIANNDGFLYFFSSPRRPTRKAA